MQNSTYKIKYLLFLSWDWEAWCLTVWGVIHTPERNTAWNKGRKCFHCLGAPNNLIRPWTTRVTSWAKRTTSIRNKSLKIPDHYFMTDRYTFCGMLAFWDAVCHSLTQYTLHVLQPVTYKYVTCFGLAEAIIRYTITKIPIWARCKYVPRTGSLLFFFFLAVIMYKSSI